MSNKVPNFRVGIQVADAAGTADEGEARYTSWVRDSSIASEFATDLDLFDPDAVRIGVEVEQNVPLDRDFRIGAQAFDRAGSFADTRTKNDTGPMQYTPWASQGGGWTGLASDADSTDPDAYRVVVETREWQTDRVLGDFRLGIQMFDRDPAFDPSSPFSNTPQQPGNVITFTPWASAGGGWADYALDLDSFDPDGLKLKLEVRFA